MNRSLVAWSLLLVFASAASANMLADPSFESGPASWTFTGSAGPTNWTLRSGDTGVVVRGWESSPASFYQEVATTATGAYTFGIWVLKEANHISTTNRLTLSWLDSGGSPVQPDAVADFVQVPRDGLWHYVFVTGVCTSTSLAKIRATVFSAWNSPADPRSYFMDDADLYAGPYAGTPLDNGSFELISAGWDGTGWPKSRWRSNIGWNNGGEMGVHDWNCHTGTNDLILYSWNNVSNNYRGYIIQHVNPASTGTYFFSIWIRQEANAWFSNAVLRMQWYDSTFTNAVQADSVSNLVVPNDGIYHEYYVEGVLTSPAAREARLSLTCDWSYNPGADPRSVMIDDARFLPMPYSEATNPMITDWCYHNSMGYNPRGEQVPGTNVGSFLQVNYASTTVTFYVLAESPSQARYYPLEENRWELRASWWDWGINDWTSHWYNMTRLGDVVIPSGASFHGLPAVGAKTASLWKLVWPMPVDGGGVPYTNRTLVYYAPFTKVTNAGVQTDFNYLLAWSGTLTNNLGQHLGKDPYNRDYAFDLNPVKWESFTNGGFGEPSDPFTNNLDNTGWFGIGGVVREHWAGRSGTGALFQTWNDGKFELYQDVATTGGTHQFTGWIQVQTGSVPVEMEISMEWYNKSGALVQENKQAFWPDPYRELNWGRIGVVGHCAAADLDYVRLLLRGYFNRGVEVSSTMIDDMELGSVPTDLQNGGFETGIWRDVAGWYGMPPYFAAYGPQTNLVEIHEWAWHSGSNGAAFHGYYSNNPQYEAQITQPIAAPTGTYICSVWIKREVNFINLTNTELRLEWYGGDYPNKVQPDSVALITPPNDNTWYQYAVTGTCLNTGLRFVQPALLAQWPANPENDQRSFMIDDVELIYTNVGGETYTDGIPDSWWGKYGIPAGQRQQTNSSDGDIANNGEEYAADTDPTSDASVFTNKVMQLQTNAAGRLVMRLIVGPPTTNSRVYDAWWKTNLRDTVNWTPFGLNVQGAGGGGTIFLIVTNEPGQRFYRTGVKVP